MPKNLNDYLTYKQASFEEEPFNEVDSLVLCTISYLHLEFGKNFETFHNKNTFIPLPDALCGVPYSKMFGTSWLRDFHGERFMYALLQNRRYMSCKVGNFVEENDDAIDKQFCAMTFMLDDGCLYIAFRGTDDSMAGWKENFDISFEKCTQSQKRAQEYVSQVHSALPGRLLRIGGHSKGGNIAEYAALTCSDDEYSCIEAIYNHDGPGFENIPSPRFYEKSYNSKLHKTVPKSSVFGMLMEKRKNYHIVDGTDILFRMHAPLNWFVEGDDFVKADEFTVDAIAFDSAMNEWEQAHTPAERKKFIDTFFGVFESAGVRTWTEFDADHIKNLRIAAETTNKLDKDTRSMLLNTLGEAFKITGDKSVQQIKNTLSRAAATFPKVEFPKPETNKHQLDS